jgi:hypothetical protein
MEIDDSFEGVSFVLLVHVYICVQVLLCRHLPNTRGMALLEVLLIVYPYAKVLKTCLLILSVSTDPVLMSGVLCVTVGLADFSLPEPVLALFFSRDMQPLVDDVARRLTLLGYALIIVAGRQSYLRGALVLLGFMLMWYGRTKHVYQLPLHLCLLLFFWQSGFRVDLVTVMLLEVLECSSVIPLLGVNVLTQCAFVMLHSDMLLLKGGGSGGTEPDLSDLPLWALNRELNAELNALVKGNFSLNATEWK